MARTPPLCLIAKGGLARPMIRHAPEARVEALKLKQYGWIVLARESDLCVPTKDDDDAA